MSVGDLVQDTKEPLTSTTRIGIITAENNHYYPVTWLYVPKGFYSYELHRLHGLSIAQHYYKIGKTPTLYRVKDVLGND